MPIVTVRLEKINGKTGADYKKDSTSKISPHVFSNEYRVTYRDTLSATEKIIKGDWIGKAVAGKEIPVSIEDNFAKRNHLNVGDKLLFNVQGLPMPTYVASVRQVNWNKIQTNFQVIFPAGILEKRTANFMSCLPTYHPPKPRQSFSRLL